MGHDREPPTSPLPTPPDPELGATFDELEPLSADVLAKLHRRAPTARPPALQERAKASRARPARVPSDSPGSVPPPRAPYGSVGPRGSRAATRHARVNVAPASARISRTLLAPLAVGLLVTLGLGVYGRVHSPASYPVDATPFTNVNYVKAWLASVTAACALAQLASGPALARRVDSDPVVLDVIHRWSGRLAVLASVPVAADCLYAMGFQADDTRVLVHGCVGCLFYGAFTAKMLAIGRTGLPRWSFPVLGALMFTCVALLWLTSALWLFSTAGVHL